MILGCFFFARITSCVFSTDCNERFREVRDCFGTDSSDKRFEKMTIAFLERVALAIRRHDNIF